MVIVGGKFEVDPEQREAFLAERHELMRRREARMGASSPRSPPIRSSRPGSSCSSFWESQTALDAHLAAISVTTTVTPRSASITLYDVAGERPLR